MAELGYDNTVIEEGKTILDETTAAYVDFSSKKENHKMQSKLKIQPLQKQITG